MFYLLPQVYCGVHGNLRPHERTKTISVLAMFLAMGKPSTRMIFALSFSMCPRFCPVISRPLFLRKYELLSITPPVVPIKRQVDRADMKPLSHNAKQGFKSCRGYCY